MPDTQLRFEARTLPTVGYERICDIDVALPGSSGVVELSNWTNGRLLVPAWWDKTDELVTDSAGCMIVAYLGDTFIDEFKATRVTKPDKRPSQRALTGPQVNGILEGLAIFPYDWPNQVEGALDWIWGGENALPDLSYAGLGNISATYELYLSGERYELDVSLATAGDYTLGYNGNNTSAIDWDATHSEIKTAVEGLPGITEVTVLQPDPDTREFFLVFENPKDLSPDLTANFGGLNVAGNLTKLNDGFDTGTDPTFTMTVDGDTTEGIDWDTDDNGLEGTATGGTGLQGLTTVNDVVVEGAGTAADPFTIAFYDPAAPGSVSVNFAAGTAVLTSTQAGALDPGRITRSKPVDRGVGAEEVYGEYDDPALEVDTTVTNTGSDYSIKVNVEGRYGGSQVVFDVTPGQTYQAEIPIRKTVTGLHTLVIRGIDERLIAQTSPRDNLLAADGSFHDLAIVDVVIPDGVTQVVMREANTDPSAATWAPHYADWQNARFTEGQPPATATKIVRQLVEAAQDRGAFEFLDLDFTDTEDTAGNPLDEINFTAFFGAGANLAQVLGNLHRSGYEWRVRRKDTPVGNLTHDLQMWAPGEGPDDKTTGGSGPSILAGSGTTGAEVVRRAAPYTTLLAHGFGSLVKEDTNSTTEAAQGRIERVLDAEHLSSEDALQEFLDAQFAEEAVNRLAATATIRADAQAVPLVDYGEGDKVWWQFPGLLDKEARRVRRIGWVHGSTATFTVQGSKVLTEEAAIRQALDRLLKEFRRRRSPKAAATRPPVIGGGGIPDVVLAASDTKYADDADLVSSDFASDDLMLQAALDLLPDDGGWVHLLAGTYTLTGRVVFGPSVKLTGAGEDSTLITIADGAAVGAELVRVVNGVCSIEDLTIDGNKVNGATATALVQMARAQAARLHIRNAALKNCSGYGIFADRPAGSVIFESVRVTGNTGDGAQLDEVSSSADSGSHFSSNGGHGVEIQIGNGNWLEFSGCRVEGNGGDGITNGGLLGGGAITVDGCWVRNNAGDGVQGNGGGGDLDIAIITNNVIIGNGGVSAVGDATHSVIADNYMADNGTDIPTPDHGNVVGGVATAPSAVTETPDAIPYSYAGDAVVGSGTFRFYCPQAGTIEGVRLAAGTAPTGADLICDLNLNGVTVFTTQANRPTVTAGGNVSVSAVPDVTALAAGDFLTVDIDQIGSTVAGADLTLIVDVAWELP